MNNMITFIICLQFTWIKCNGQTTQKLRTNALSFEVGKSGLIYNLSFDHKLSEKNFGFRVTIGSNFSNYLRAFSTFGGGYYLVGKSKNNLELGFDIGYLSVEENRSAQRDFSFIFPNYSIKTYYTNLNIGFRKYGNRSLFRIGASPSYSKSGPFPGAYISYGITF